MYIVVTLEIDEMPETIQDLAKAKSWRIVGTEEFPPKVIINPERRLEDGYGASSVPAR